MNSDRNPAMIIGVILLMFFSIIGITAIIISVLNNDPAPAIDDNSYHLGYHDCERNFNYSSEEQRIVNEYRMNLIASQAKNCTQDLTGRNCPAIAEEIKK